ncbi:hypothetical protein [Streptomyces sp. KL116D]|uniref:hypothetical protein n=1 Tax=Streptomyces sp. KL116D TaxID=3045152 RepID=UPI003557E5B0
MSCASLTTDQEHRVLGQVTSRRRRRPTTCSRSSWVRDVEARRSFIQRNAKDVRFLDI